MKSTYRIVTLTAMAALLLVVSACLRSPGSGPSGSGTAIQAVSGRATAGPSCPVERNPPDPACAARPVAGAVLVINDASTGNEVARVTTDAAGRFSVSLAPGSYRLVPQSVAGLMGGARPVHFAVYAGRATPMLEVSYDTGIR